ncbi:hypothetical protein ACFVVM_00895 [Nocardia sp. NPDC058176]|uniref:hypothetical protein n=1 Tax=Nocardia sp. NPDC058176 TaxID=3346368 RepID=UPI0036DB7487
MNDSPAPTPPTDPTSTRRETAAKVLLWLAAAGAAVAALSSIPAVLDAGSATKIVETWRGYGFVVFAGLFALLALRPHGYRGVWELVIFHKVALTLTAVVFAVQGGVDDTATVIVGDGILSVLLVLAYVLARGWLSPDRARG